VSILYYTPGTDSQTVDDEILNELKANLPEHTISVWPDCSDKASITTAIVWKPPHDFFDALINLKQILSMAAGVDHLLNHPALPDNAAIVRLTDAGMAEPMAQYILYGVLHAQRHMFTLAQAQRDKQWRHDVAPQPAKEFQVGILGAGELGLVAAKRLLDNGYKVSCWSRSSKNLENIEHFSGEHELNDMLPQLNVLVCLLPLTPDTSGIIDAVLLKQLPAGSFLINSGRGDHADESAVLEALNSGQLSGALLDVFCEEPLPESNPLWSHPNVIVTPHVAAPTQVTGSVEQLVESVHQLERGEKPRGLVDRRSGY